MKRLYSLCVLLIVVGYVLAQQAVSFNVQAPTTVVKGQQFRVSYVLEGANGGNLELLSEFQGFDVIYGPAISTSSSVTVINGKTTSSISTSYIYTLVPKEEGTFSLPAARITAKGESYTTKSVKVKVLPPDKNAQSGTSQSGGRNSGASSASKYVPTANDIFIRPVFSKTKVYEQEVITLTYKLYTLIDVLAFVDYKYPKFEGFVTEPIDLPVNRQFTMEHYNGKNYYVMDVTKYILLPQKTGDLVVPEAAVTMTVSYPSGKTQMTFFGPMQLNTEENMVLKTKPTTIQVSALPSGKPLGFLGGVGSMKMTTSLSENKITANEPLTYKVSIKGSGNLKYLREPEIEFPKEFEVFEPKITNDFKITTNGYTGSKVFEYTVIPRYPGEFEIPAFEYAYFDASTGTYKKESSPSYKIAVAKDPNASAVSNQPTTTKAADADIRNIKANKPDTVSVSDLYTGTMSNILWYILPFILFIIIAILYRKQIEANADIIGLKKKNANKMATRRLKLARKYMNTNKPDEFHEEVLRALWGYLSDKLVIPVADLNRENIENELIKYGSEPDLIQSIIDVLDTCEYARYAPAAYAGEMKKLYDSTVDVISSMESVIRKNN